MRNNFRVKHLKLSQTFNSALFLPSSNRELCISSPKNVSEIFYEREVGSRYKLVWLRCYTATSLRLKTECENDDLYIMTARHLLCKFATKIYHFNIENKSSHQNRHTPATLLHRYALKRKAHTLPPWFFKVMSWFFMVFGWFP